MCNLDNIFFLFFYLTNLIYVSIFNIIWLNKKIILIKKFSKHNQINASSYKIKYLNLYLSFDIFNFIFSYL